MAMEAEYDVGRSVRQDGGQSIRTTLAYSVLMLGLAGSLSIAPMVIWAIAVHGFH